MRYWEGIFYLTGYFFKQARWKNIIGFIFVTYLLITMFSDYKQIMFDSDVHIVRKIFLDYIFLIMMSCVGLFATHINSYGAKKDLLGERLAYLRSLPIRADQIVWARIIAMTISMLICTLLFYGSFYVILRLNDYQIEFFSFFTHMLAVISVALIGNMLFLYCDLIFNLKKYTLICWIMPIVIAAIVTGYVLLTGKNAIQFIQESSVSHPLLLLLLSIVMLVLTIIIGFNILNKKLRQRSIL